MSNENKIFLGLSCYNNYQPISEWYEHGVDSGLGNLLFQVASALAYADTYSSKLCVPALNTYFNYEQIKKENSIFRLIDTNLSDYNNVIYIDNPEPYNCHASHDIFVHPFKNRLLLLGYFERYKNFNDKKQLILDYFSPNENDIKYITEKYPQVTQKTTCSVHIRGGKRWVETFLGGEDGIDKMRTYYNDCIEEMIRKKEIKTLLILTNDKPLATKILKDWEKKLEIIYSNELPHIDIWIISLIKNNISSASSLSWWGSYLNKNEDKIVITNTRFCLDYKMIQDYFLPEWVCL